MGDTTQGPTTSRIIHPGVNACEGWPRCRFEGTRDEVKLHQRECYHSDSGALYRVWMTVKPR